MLPAIEGYCRYLLVDASLLPGSGGNRRRVASLKGTMCAPGCDPSALRGLAARDGSPPPLNSPYAAVNAAFNAFLEGRAEDCAAAVAAEVEAIKAKRAERTRELGGTCDEEECVDISVICNLLATLQSASIDGRTYRAISGGAYAPVDVRILFEGGK